MNVNTRFLANQFSVVIIIIIIIIIIRWPYVTV